MVGDYEMLLDLGFARGFIGEEDLGDGGGAGVGGIRAGRSQ